MKLLLQRLEKLSVDEKKLKTFSKEVRTKTVRKQLGGGKKKSKRRTIRTISRKIVQKSVALAKTFLTR